MYQIKTFNQISEIGLAELDTARFQVSDSVENEDGIIVRSAKLHDYAFPASLRAIARAGAGTNNIPVDRCSEAGIVVFNTPGANANAVKEEVIFAMLACSRKLMEGAAWAKREAEAGGDVLVTMEKAKSNFVGPEIMGKTLGIIGLGAIGAKVAEAAILLGMKVVGYDPYLSVPTALALNSQVKVVPALEDLLKESDYITIHIPKNPSTVDTIDAAAIARMKDGARVINLARDGLVNEDAICAALESGKVAAYVTDFPSSKIAGAKNAIALPHLGASTPESEENCAVMAAREIQDYLLNGNIRNSVNFPSVEMERSGAARVCVLHRNVPAMLAQITDVLGKVGINVENMTNKSKKDLAYTMLDVNEAPDQAVVEELSGQENILRVIVL